MRTIVQRMRKGNRQGSLGIYDSIKTKLKYLNATMRYINASRG